MDKLTKRKKIFIVFFGASLIFLYFLIAYQTKKPNLPKNVDPTKTYMKLPEYVKGSLPLKMDKQVLVGKKFPGTLPTLSFKLKQISDDELVSIAQSLGFTSQPLTAVDVIDGSKKIWNSQTASLWISPSKGYINYYSTSDQTISGPGFSEEELQKNSLDFLVKKIGFSPEQILKTSTLYLTDSDNPEVGFISTSKDKAKVYQFNFTYVQAGYPIFTQIPTFQVIYVQILPSGTIQNVGVYLLENVKKSIEEYSIKSLDDIPNSLNQAEIVEIENDYLSLNDISINEITDIQTGSVEIGYFFNPLLVDQDLKPIFKLHGSIKIKGSSADYATLYMPAYK